MVRDSLKQKIPVTTRISTRRRIQDLAPSLAFRLNGSKQRQAQKELDTCHSIPDYLAFAKRWLGAGAIQVVPEIQGALDFVRAESPRRACEIGTDFGGTTFLLSQLLPSLELLIGVDLYIKNRAQLAALAPRNVRLELLNGSSYAPRTIERVQNRLRGAKLDLLLIDGDHRYEGVLQDFLKYRHLVRDNGLILFHDIVPDYTTRYGRPTGAYSGGVPLVWERLSALYPARTFINKPNQDGMGIGVLRYDPSIPIPNALAQVNPRLPPAG